MTLTKTNPKQFVLVVLGLRKPGIGEVFEIEVPPRRVRVEVECVDRQGQKALVERTDDGPAPASEVRSRVISDRKTRPPDMPYGTSTFAHSTATEILAEIAGIRDHEDYLDMMDSRIDEDW